MLRIIPQSNAGAARSYYSKADYYVDGPESSGVWGGKGAEKLGLRGEVAWEDFSTLCDNLHPQTGKSLTPRTREDRRVLYDWNFHVPKSVSLAYELGGDQRIQEAFRQSVDDTMREAETEMKVRVRAKGANEDRLSGNMTYATFIHRTSRPSKEDKLPDPHLHAHVTCFNCSYDEQAQKWKAGQFGDLKKDAPYFQAKFHSVFAQRLKALGYGITRTAKGFELSGIAAETVRKFSRRTNEIEALAKEMGITDPAGKDKLGALSRMAKSSLTMPDLQSYWRWRLSDSESQALNQLQRHPSWGLFTASQAFTMALDDSLERESVVPERQFYTAALQFGLGASTLDMLKAQASRHALIETEWNGQRVISSRAVLAQEKDLLDFARKGRGSKKPLHPDGTITRDYLHPDQARAVQHVWNSSDQVMLIRGAAGVGKTTLTKEAVEGLEREHIPVVMLAPSAAASREVLKAEGFANADTVARFLLSAKDQAKAKGGVIWVDEAGLISTRDMHRLFEVAQRQQSRVILMGDTRQFGSISRGPALALLESHAGLPCVQVTDIKRQKDAYKQLAGLLAQGLGAQALEQMDRLRWVHELEGEERISAIVQSYLDAKSKGSVLLVAPTKNEGAHITDAIRARLKKDGVLGQERPFVQLVSLDLTEAQRRDPVSYEAGNIIQFHQAAKGHAAGARVEVTGERSLPLAQANKFQAFRKDTIQLAIGDDIRMTAPGKSLDGHRFNNGSAYRIKGFTKDGDIVLNNRWVVSREFGHWAHNLVSTAVSAQGKTVDRVILAQSESSGRAGNQAQFYVAISRGKYAAAVFVDSKEALRDAVQRPVIRISAIEAFANKKFPHALGRRAEMIRRWRHVEKFRVHSTSHGQEKQLSAGEKQRMAR